MTARKPKFTRVLVVGVFMLTIATEAPAPPPNINQCKTRWTLTPSQQMNFGSFAIESGSGTISMSGSAALSTTGTINLSASNPVTTYSANATNSLGADCATYGFTLAWNTLPAPLAGPGTAMPLSNVRISVPAYGISNATLPQTIAASPGNPYPFALSLFGDISVTSPQTAGLYTSPAFTVDLVQSGTATPVSGTASATAFTPLSIVESVALDFGTVAGGQLSGTVVVATGGGRTTTGDAQALASGPGSPATFQVTGQPGLVYSVAFSNGVLANAGGQQISVTTFTDNSAGTIPGSGVESFQVGATLNLGANQPAGFYSTANGGGNPYTVTINYN